MAFSVFSRGSSSGCLMAKPALARSPSSRVTRLVKAIEAAARSIAFLNLAVAISSIVRVILRMLRIDLRLLSRARVLAILQNQPNRVRIAVPHAFFGFHSRHDREDQAANHHDDRTDDG